MKEPKPNPLQRELARSQAAAPHPDADLLTAFAEGTLAAREREAVFAHLAVCAECREVVSLAAGAEEEAVVSALKIQPEKARPGILRWLPWAATAVGIVVVCSAVLMREPQPPSGIDRYSGPRESAKFQTQPAPIAGTTTASPTATANDKQRAFDSTKETELAKLASPSPVIMADKDKGAPGYVGGIVSRRDERSEAGAASGGASLKAEANSQQLPLNGRNSMGLSQLSNSNAPSPAANSNNYSPVQNNAAVLRSNQTAFGAAQNNQMNSNQPALAQPAKSAPPPSSVSETVEVQSAAVQVQEDSVAIGGLAYDKKVAALPEAKKDKLSKSRARAHWRISDDGRLQRGFGDGEWQGVLANETAKFRVVSVLGSEVWAGGENSRLYHSTDNGEAWTLVALPVKNGVAHTIIRIHFESPQVGSAECEDGAVWITTDAGRTWK